MKRLSLVCLMVSMAAGAAGAACIPANAKTVTIRFWSWATPELVKVEKALIKEFERDHPNIRVAFESASSDVSILSTKLLTSVAANVAPDVTWCDNNFGPKVASKGLFLDLANLAKQDKSFDMKDFLPSALAALSWKGAQFGLPEGCSAQYMFYNKTLFDARGLVAPTDEYTWDDAVSMAQKLTVKQGNGISQPGIEMASWWWTSMNTILQFGGDLWNPDATKSLVNSVEAAKAFELLRDLTTKYGVMKPGSDFLTGKVGMVSEGHWRFMDIPDKAKFKWGTMLLPKGSRVASWLAVGGPAILKSTKHRQEAWEFAKFRVSKAAMLLDHSDGHSYPTRSSLLKTREFMTPKRFPEESRSAVFDMHAKYIAAVAPTPYMGEMQNAIQLYGSQIISGKLSPANGLGKMAAEMDRWLKPRR